MNKGNLNKLVTNYPIELTEEEIANLSGTLAPVIAACGGGGGGTGGKIYTGVGFVTVNNTTNQIGLTNEANTKLNQDIPTKVSDLSDSANYQTVAGMDEYLTTGAAQDTYLTKSSADTLYAPLSTTADVEALKAASGDFSQYYTKNETYSKNEVYTKGDVYQKTETSSNSELANAFIGIVTDSELQNAIDGVNQTIYILQDTVAGKQDKLTFGYDENNAISSIDNTPLAGQGGTTYTNGAGIEITNDTISISSNYIDAITSVSSIKGTILTGDSNIRATSAEAGNNIKWTLELTAQPVVTDTTLSGYDGIVATKDSTVSSQWNVGIAQAYREEIEAVSSKLTKASADTLYAPISVTGDVNTLKSSSGDWDKVSDKLDTTAFSDVSGTFLTTIPDTYATKEYANNASANALSEAETWVGQQGFYTKASGDNDYAPISITATVNTLTAASAGWNEVSAKLGTAQYALDSATFVTSSNLTITGTKQYALTTAGWAEVQAGTSFTGVTTTGSISGGGVNNDTIGLLTSAENALTAVANKVDKPDTTQTSLNNKYLVYSTLSGTGEVTGWIDFNENVYSKSEADGRYQKIANMSSYLTTAQYATDSATFVTSSNASISAAGEQYALTTTGWAKVQGGTTGNYLPLSGGTVSGELNISGGSSFDTQFLKFSRDSVQATSRIGVGSNGALVFKHNNGAGQNIQMEISTEYENNAYKNGSIIVKAGNTEKSKVVNVSISGANNMSAFDATNGPNYMLRKTADGFDIGAAVINVTSLPQNTEANAYYFVYDV